MREGGTVQMRVADVGDVSGRTGEATAEKAEGHTDDHRLKAADVVRIAVVALASAAVWLQVWEPFPHVSVIGLVGALVGIYPIVKEAFEAVIAHRMTMELPTSRWAISSS
jgi:hypothetical protein